METITPAALKAELDSGKELLVLDVREEHELANGAIPGHVHVRMAQVPHSLDKLPKDADIVVVCRTGNRSGQVATFLVRQGYAKVRNLEGGMNGYARDVDSSMSEY
ncbi:MAG: hypothetical protein KF857_08810 [Fimbriimonadaceae bacterium]|nr:hypothetical protein [Fimbriimonadaceae bacterium]